MNPHARLADPASEDRALEGRLTGGILPRRILAFVLDGIVVTILAALAWTMLMLFGLLTLGLAWPLLGLLPALPTLYNWVFAASAAQATPGQAAMGLRLVRDDDLGRPNTAQALVWAAGFTITVVAGAVWLLIALVTRRHRAAHDIVAGVTVVRTTPLTATTRAADMKVGNIWAA